VIWVPLSAAEFVGIHSFIHCSGYIQIFVYLETVYLGVSPYQHSVIRFQLSSVVAVESGI